MRTLVSLSVCRARCTELIAGEVGKVLGEKWKALSDAEKKPYEDKAKAEKDKYVKVKADYDASSKSCSLLCTNDRIIEYSRFVVSVVDIHSYSTSAVSHNFFVNSM